MIIQSLRIDRFGKWKGLTLKNLETGINLFYGPNEAGKTKNITPDKSDNVTINKKVSIGP